MTEVTGFVPDGRVTSWGTPGFDVARSGSRDWRLTGSMGEARRRYIMGATDVDEFEREIGEMLAREEAAWSVT